MIHRKGKAEKKKKERRIIRGKPIIVTEGLKLYTIILAKYVEIAHESSSCIMDHYVFILLLIPDNFKIFDNKILFYNTKV